MVQVCPSGRGSTGHPSNGAPLQPVIGEKSRIRSSLGANGDEVYYGAGVFSPPTRIGRVCDPAAAERYDAHC
jgi:hypothetical protein